ncbi:Maf family protein [Marinomonas ostreistagni]|uniref:Maf family protein n=1 Tax=Marinomonas ostreistagni TaxID=359209 RepID=UPI0019510A3C|nr:nucleoside triphosphate pyrophosphatase [Marinomonas ostreistagni]MBM6549997.1 septum formation protein Maf [Marinomonas ostreistagni]
MTYQLVLGSSSKYRKKLLERLRLPFTCLSPEVDESRVGDETPEAYVERISKAKARAIIKDVDDQTIVITSDQCATFKDEIIGKPHTVERAAEQLLHFSGQSVRFLTGLYVFNTATLEDYYALAEYTVTFRDLTLEDVMRYVEAEQPLDCAGSFKCEQLGVALFEKMAGDDPTSLEGLPLIETCKALRVLGLDPLAKA